MKTALIAVLVLAGAAAVWLFGGVTPERAEMVDAGAADRSGPARDAVLPIQGAPPSEKEGRRTEPPPAPRTLPRTRDRVGKGSGSATIRVLDGAGQPVVGAKVVARLRKLPREARPVGSLSHTTESGHAKLRGLAKELVEALLVFPPPSREDLARHTVPSWAGEDAVVTLPQGYTLACVVRDHRGIPLPRATISIRKPGGNATGYAVDAEGRHRFVNLPEGWYEVRAQRGTKISELVRARAGGPEVVLEIDNRGHATIRIDGWRPGAFAVRGRLWPDPRKGTNHVYLDVGPRDGTIEIQGANPDAVYNLWLGTRDGRELIYETDLRIDGREIVVRPKPAFHVSGRLITPAGAKVTAINVQQAGVFLKGTWVGTETYEVRGLPEGTWWIIAMGRCPDGRLRGHVEVRAGDTADLELKLRR